MAQVFGMVGFPTGIAAGLEIFSEVSTSSRPERGIFQF